MHYGIQVQIALKRLLFRQLTPLFRPAHSFGLLTALPLRYPSLSRNLGTGFFNVVLDEVAVVTAIPVCRVRAS